MLKNIHILRETQVISTLSFNRYIYEFLLNNSSFYLITILTMDDFMLLKNIIII